MRRRWALLLLASSLAFSQPPSPTPAPSTKNNQGKTTTKDAVASQDKSYADPISAAINKLASEVASWKDKQTSDKSDRNASPEWWLKWSTITSAIAALAIASLGGFQWWAMHRQAKSMREALCETRKSAALAERALHLTERADVLVDKIELTDPRILVNSHVALKLRNFGRTRANNIVVQGHYGLREIGNMDGFTPGFSQGVPFVLGSNGEMKFRSRHTLSQIIAGELWDKTFKTDEYTFRVWGSITYVDVFNGKQTVEFSAKFMPPDFFLMEKNEAAEDRRLQP